MKRNELTKGVMAALLLTSSLAMAEEYPAADYQPKVLYTNPDYKTEAASAPAAAKPAAKAKEAEVVEQDANFPAANYQPKVLFTDSAYKHDKSAPQASSSSNTASAVAVASEESSAGVEAKSEGSSNNLIGLIALAAVGFFLYSKKSGSKSAGTSGSSASHVDAGGATGVEKYLDKIGANKTGVAKYLEKQNSNPATGVAKYMAKQIVKDREAAAAKATGVEKYLRDRG